jgi:hypothetical protein
MRAEVAFFSINLAVRTIAAVIAALRAYEPPVLTSFAPGPRNIFEALFHN